MSIREVVIAFVFFGCGMIIAFYASIFAIGLDCQPGKEEGINLDGRGDKQVILEFKP